MSWRFALQPKWIIRHVAVVLLVVTMVLLGFWQLRRLDEKRDYKALVEARQAQPAEDVQDVVPDVAVGDPAVDGVLYRQVTATGTYQDDDTVAVDNRTLNGASGGWVLTPLLLDDGTAIVVNRGFIGHDRQGELAGPPPPDGRVEVSGLVFPSQHRGSIGPTDPAEGKLDVLARADLVRFEAQVDYDVLPAYIQLVDSHPAEPGGGPDDPILVALGPPDPTEGPHLSYAVQWFTFTTIALVGYGLLLRKVAQEEGRRLRTPPDPLDEELVDLVDREA